MEIDLTKNSFARIEFPHNDEPEIKPCPFCAETIQAAAVKCRFCGEFLNSERAKALLEENSQTGKPSNGKPLFMGRPSLFGLAGLVIKIIFVFALAVFLIRYPVEKFFAKSFENSSIGELTSELESADLVNELPAKQVTTKRLSEDQITVIAQYRVIVGISLIILVVLIFFWKTIKLKMIYYRVTVDRIEWSRGIFDRKVDNIDMFRVVDISLRRTLLDCLFGIGTVKLITNDKTAPQFIFEKVHRSRRLYDAIKTASLNADQKRGVVHLE